MAVVGFSSKRRKTAGVGDAISVPVSSFIPKRQFRVRTHQSKQSIGVVADSLASLKAQGCLKLSLLEKGTELFTETGRPICSPADYADLVDNSIVMLIQKKEMSSGFRLVLRDGTQVDDEDYFQLLPQNTLFIFLLPHENYLEETCIEELLAQLEKLHMDTLKFSDIVGNLGGNALGEVIKTVMQLTENSSLDSIEEDPGWFIGLKSTRSKRAYMRKIAAGRIANYFKFVKTRSLETDLSGMAKNHLMDVIDAFEQQLNRQDRQRFLFDRSAPSFQRLCDESGNFKCQGLFDASLCRWLSQINPYASAEKRQDFGSWNLDHGIEKQQVISTLLDSVAAIPNGQRLNWEYFYDMLFTTHNLKFVETACHSKADHNTMCDPTKVYAPVRL